MNVLHIISSLKHGGAENLLVQLIEQLNTKGVTNSVLYFHEGPYSVELQKIGINPIQIKGLFFRYDPIFFIRLWRCIKQIKPDCIHSSLWMANIASRLCAWWLRIPQINSIHNNIDQDGIVRNILDKYTFKLSSNIVAVSQGVSHSIKNYYKNNQTVNVITNGINYQRVFELSQKTFVGRSYFGLTSEHFIIGSVGRFVPVKNYPLLLNAFKLLLNLAPKARLILVGTGPEERRLRLYVKELGLDAFVHFVIGKPAYGFYPLFDCFCLSSYKEGISIALLEAMSLKRACVVTNFEIKHDVIQDEINGLVVPSFHPHELTNALLKITDPDFKKSLATMAQTTIYQQFSIDTMTDSYYQLYKRNIQNQSMVNI